MALHPGQQFGRYELMFRLGHGGMAETWRARLLGEAGVTKPVLIKSILPEYANDEAFTTMFVSEARISATLSHGNIAQVYDFGRMDEEYFLAMEFVDGQTLHRLIRRTIKSGLSAIPTPLASFVALEMCRGLHYAHSRTDENGKPLGIVHRDISPDNVLISYEGQVKIVDFGIAKARELRGFNTEPGIVKGKYLFFSPEQAQGEEVDARTDIWATGIVLYEMLCGQLPVKGPHYAAVPKLIQGEFPRPRELNPNVPEELEAIVMRALAIDKEERYESSHELGDALTDFLHSTAPRTSAMTLSHFVLELFREDLSIEGRTVKVPHSFQEQLALWRKGEKSKPAPSKPSAQPTGRVDDRAETELESQPASSWTSRPMVRWGAGGIAAALLASGAGFVAMRSPQPHETTAPGAHIPGAPIDATAAEQSPPPVQMLSVEARTTYKNAFLAFQKKEYGEAVAWIKDCVNLEPANIACQLLAGDASAELGDMKSAVPHYHQFLELAPQHEEAPRVRGILAQYERTQSKAPEGPVPAPQAEEPKPHTTLITRTESPSSVAATLVVRQATAAVKSGDFKSAVPLFRDALRLNPNSLEAREGLGFCLAMGGTSSMSGQKEAIRLLRDAVKDESVKTRAWFALGMALQVTQQNADAIQAFKQYLELDPTGKYSDPATRSLQALKARR